MLTRNRRLRICLVGAGETEKKAGLEFLGGPDRMVPQDPTGMSQTHTPGGDPDSVKATSFQSQHCLHKVVVSLVSLRRDPWTKKTKNPSNPKTFLVFHLQAIFWTTTGRGLTKPNIYISPGHFVQDHRRSPHPLINQIASWNQLYLSYSSIATNPGDLKPKATITSQSHHLHKRQKQGVTNCCCSATVSLSSL